VAHDERVERAAERGAVDLTVEPDRDRDVVERRSRL